MFLKCFQFYTSATTDLPLYLKIPSTGSHKAMLHEI